MQRLERALDTWREWDAPVRARPACVRELAAGHTNHSYLLADADARYVLRLNTDQARVLRIDREHEWRCHAAAAATGIAPAIVYRDAGDGFFVTAFVDGCIVEPAPADGRLCEDLLTLAARIHALDVALPVADYYAHAAAYRDELEARSEVLSRADLAMHSALLQDRRRYAPAATAVGTCHRDLSPGNVMLSDGSLVVLDWEYACRGWTAFDAAALVVEWRLPPARVATAYRIDAATLAHATALYRHTCALWWRLRGA